MIRTKLKTIRESKGINQKELAKILGVTESAVSHWEAGRYAPTTDKLLKIARFYGVTVDELIGDEYEQEPEAAA